MRWGCRNVKAFSVGVEYLYYRMPQDDLRRCVKECICEDNNGRAFIDRCGISVEGFLELLGCYLKPTLISWDGKMYIQKSGVCIGSIVAPVLRTIFLDRMDREIDSALKGTMRKVFRYMDDYLVVVGGNRPSTSIAEVLWIFKEKGMGLNFPFESPEDNQIQFLDLSL